MAKENAGDVLTCDWNPVIGCARYSAGCKNCWFLDGIFPWQQRLGNIPNDVEPGEHFMFEKRMSITDLRKRKGIVGIVQHGDLFWSKVPERVIHAVLDIVDETATLKKGGEKYLLWTKRAQRMSKILTDRYRTLPEYLGVAVTVEDQKTADERLPFLAGFGGMKAIVIEPQLEEITLKRHLDGISWVIEGSETGRNARPFNLDWARKVRDETKARDIPFFIKQMGNDHKHQVRVLDAVAWTEFPQGWIK